MSEIDKFMGNGPAPKAKEAETAPQAGLPTMTAEQFQALLAAVAGGTRALPKTPEEIKAEAEANRLMYAAPNIDMNDRVWITLSENEDVPRGGQFIGVNGSAFLLKPGKKAYVPRALTKVLDDAIKTVAHTGSDSRIEDYRDVMRFPYQVHATGP